MTLYQPYAIIIEIYEDYIMGGNLFKNAKRHDNNSFQRKQHEVINYLNNELNIDVRPIPHLSHKDSHGDLDLILNKDTFSIDDLYHIASLYPYAINGKHVNIHQLPQESFQEYFDKIDNLSFDYNDLQVDLIFIDQDSVDFAVNYHSYNDLGGIIGCITKQLGYSLGREGLFQEVVPIDGYGKYKVYLTKDFKEFCQVFELDDSIFFGDNTLRDVEDMLQYLKNWKYFNSHWMNPVLMNSTRRNRAAKRKVFNQITELCDKHGSVVNWSTKSPELLKHFDQEHIQEQYDLAYQLAEQKVDEKRSMSKERMVKVLGYEPSNVNHIFMKMSELYGGPAIARQHTYKMTDNEFKTIILDIVEDLK